MGRKRKYPLHPEDQQPTPDLNQLSKFAEKNGFSVEIKHDHIVARGNGIVIRTGSMTTLKKSI